MPLVMCERGFHASPRIIDAMAYVSPELIARVEVRGTSIQAGDKHCWSEMRVLQSWRWTAMDSVALAVFAAEQVLHLYERASPDDPRPKMAIEAAKRYLSAHGTAARAAGAPVEAENMMNQCESFIYARLHIESAV